MVKYLTGLAPADEYLAMIDVRDALVTAHVDDLAREISRAMSALDESDIDSDDPPAAWIDEHAANVTELLMSLYAEGMRIGVERVRAGLSQLETRSTVSELIYEWIADHVALHVTSISVTTFRDAVDTIRDVLRISRDDGLGTDATARMMRQRFDDMSLTRAHTIARTEAHTAANAGVHTAAVETGLPIEKEWVTVIDDRERESHHAVDGQRRDLLDPFIVDDEELMYPGDPDGSARNIINCRCAVSHTVNDLD